MNPRHVLCALLLASSVAQSAAPPAIARTMGDRLLVRYIQPATADLVRDSRALDQSLAAYCAAPARTGRRAAVEQSFGRLAETWTRVEVLRFGPLLQDNRLERFFFFPDPRGVTLRQVQALLAAADPQALAPGALRARSVAVQGLPALELALYGTEAAAQIAQNGPQGQYRCRYARAVSAALLTTAADIQAAWRADAPYAREFAAPAATLELYRNADEVATEALKALSTSLQSLHDIKLLPALGADAATARGQRLPLWRSGLSARVLAGGAQATLDFYDAAGLAAGLPADSRWIDDSLHSETAIVVADFRELSMPLDQAVVDPAQRDVAVHAALVLKNLQAITVELLAPALGIDIGFNALDGD